MKTQTKIIRKRTLTFLSVSLTLMLAFLSSNPIIAQVSKTATADVAQQERTIKGIITNADGPLESASIIQKGTKIGTATNAKGEFTFPKSLKTGDVLLVSFLGYETQEVKIKEDTDFVRLQLSDDLVEFVGALNPDTPYKSKESKD